MNTTPARSAQDTSPGKLLGARLLPIPPLEILAGRSKRLADLVESISRRRDVRELRARLLVLLFELRCPLSGRPRRPWYVPGAVARLGVEGLRRAWRGFFGEDPPCSRTLRAHLGVLERVAVIVRSPGDWVDSVEPLGGEARAAAWRARHADTIHVLETEESAAWWRAEGAAIVRRFPAARVNPDVWRARIGRGWRARALPVQLGLFDQVGASGGSTRDPRATAEGWNLSARANVPACLSPSACSTESAAYAHGASRGARPQPGTPGRAEGSSSIAGAEQRRGSADDSKPRGRPPGPCRDPADVSAHRSEADWAELAGRPLASEVRGPQGAPKSGDDPSGSPHGSAVHREGPPAGKRSGAPSPPPTDLGAPEGLPDCVGRNRAQGRSLARALAAAPSCSLDLFAALERHGIHVRGPETFHLGADRARLLGAAGLLALAWARGDFVRNPAGWLVRAFRHAEPHEMERARRFLAGYLDSEDA